MWSPVLQVPLIRNMLDPCSRYGVVARDKLNFNINLEIFFFPPLKGHFLLCPTWQEQDPGVNFLVSVMVTVV